MKFNSASFARRSFLCGAAVSAIAMSGIAHAEEAADAADESAPTEIIVTATILQAQEASIDAKRNAINVSDIAAADAVGRFPDQNSAAALSRLPAVAVQRDQGQERYIQVRGAPNRWTSVSIDGIPLTGVDEGGDSRAFRFDAVPSVMLSQMAVNKSLTADQQADAIVATIDLKTYSPLDNDAGFHITGDIGYGFMDQGGGEQRQGSVRASWSNDTVGVMVGGSHYRRKQLTDNREFAYAEDGQPTKFDIRQYKLERWNNSLFGGVEFEPVDGLRLFAKGVFTEFNDDEQRNQYVFNLTKAASGTQGEGEGDLVGVPLAGSFNYGEYRNKNYIGTFGADYDNDDGLKASGRLNYTRTDNSSYLPLVGSSSSGTNSPSMHYDLSNPDFPIITLYNTVDNGGVYERGSAITDFNQGILSIPGTYMVDAHQETVSDAYTAKFDLEKDFGTGVIIKGGAYYADRTIEGNNFSFSNLAYLGAMGGYVGQPFDVNSYVTDTPWDTQFPLGFSFNYVDNIAMRADVDSLIAKLTEAGMFDPSKSIPATDLYDQKERTLAGYVMGQMETGALTINGGVRIENYRMDNSGTANFGGVLTPLALDTDYTDFFPSLNLKFDASDNLVLRLAGQRGVSRPAYGAIRVGASVNDTNTPGTISGGNPMLAPEYTWGVDASVEYYLPTNGILSVSGFYRWVDNVFYSSKQIVGNDFYNTGGVDRSAYEMSSMFNGDNGKLYGVEFNFQNQFDFLPSPFDGLGFQGNLTLLGGNFDIPAVGDVAAQENIAFQGMSDTVANASLYYEKYGFSARVSYQWRSDWLDTLGGLGSGEYRKGYENLDVSLRYAINENLQLYADLANLTDEKYIAYEGDVSHPTEVEQIGARYMFGVRFNF